MTAAPWCPATVPNSQWMRAARGQGVSHLKVKAGLGKEQVERDNLRKTRLALVPAGLVAAILGIMAVAGCSDSVADGIVARDQIGIARTAALLPTANWPEVRGVRAPQPTRWS